MNQKVDQKNPMEEAHLELSSEISLGPIVQKEHPADMVVHSSQQLSPMQLVQISVEKGASLDQIEKMMDLAERQENKEAENAFTEAMANFKANSPVIVKDKTVSIPHKSGNGKTQYTHASLAEVSTKIAAGLGEWGLSHYWDVDQDSEQAIIKVTCFITHSKGHSKSVTMKSGLDATGQKNGLQQVASTVTYLQRYTLMACAGLAASDHDDDARGSEPEKPKNGDINEFYSEEEFDKNFETWKKSLLVGNKTKKDLVAFIKGMGKISERQLDLINKVEIPS